MRALNVFQALTSGSFKQTGSLSPQVLDTAWVLQAIHAFFQGIGPEEVRKRSAREDKPLRMVKTVLHELCKLKVRGSS